MLWETFNELERSTHHMIEVKKTKLEGKVDGSDSE